jgi:hypothetical protein
MKLIFSVLLFVVVSCAVNAQTTWEFTFTGTNCPGDTKNHFPPGSKYGVADGEMALWYLPSNTELDLSTNWGSTIFCQSSTNGYGENIHSVWIGVRFPDACHEHPAVNWSFGRFRLAGTWDVPGWGSFNVVSNVYMPDEACLVVKAVYGNITEYFGSVSIGFQTLGTLGPYHPEFFPDVRQPIVAPDLKPPTWFNLQVNNAPNQQYIVTSSTNLGASWSYETNFVTDAYGWGQADIAALGRDALFLNTSITNGP